MVVPVALRLGSFPPPHGPESMRELRDRQDAPPGIALDFFFPYPPQQADVVLLIRLVEAALTELAAVAMIVQD